MNAVTKLEPQGQVSVPVSETAAILSVIERAAMNPDVDIDKMERLLQMQERIVARNAKAAYSAAMADMQPELPAISKKGFNTHTEKTYGRWEDIHDAVTPVLSRHGFALTFRTDAADRVKVTAVLSHRDGHSEETSLTLPSDVGKGRNDVQAIGSSISYGKRYTACAILNINVGGEDNDGNGGDAPSVFLSDEQIAELEKLIKETGTDRVKFLAYLKEQSLESMPAAKFGNAKGALLAKKDAAK